MKSINKKIAQKGVTKSQIAKMVDIDVSTLSRILSGKQSYVSQDIINKLNAYLDNVNTDDKKYFKQIYQNILT